MREIIETMVSIQQAEMGATAATTKSAAASLNALRSKVPAPVLAHFDRLRTRGKKGVSNIRRGVCTECHMKVPMGTLITLAHGRDIQLCGNCGRYLHLPEEEVAISLELVVPKPVRKPAKIKVKVQTAAHAD
jgi:predicted  nucleic acid-binding Zn-ribbon protein